MGGMAEQHQVAVITGAARGIGAAIAAAVVAAGGSAVLSDLEDDRGAELAERLDRGAGGSEGTGGRASYSRCDVTSEDDVAALLAYTNRVFGPPTAVFANAGGVGVTGRLEDTELADFRRTTDLLLTSVFLTLKHGIRAMRPLGRGALVVTASVASLRGGLGPHVYTASKHAVKGLVESVAVEVAADGLTVNAVAPGGTVSSLAAGLFGDRDDLETARRRLAAASSSGVPTVAADIAAAALFLASPAARRINGACLVIDGGDDVLAAKGRGYYS
jgi:NAD(P)-dependent dehydrogenase (short-subunit alcohol dehydrogenase family)